MALSDQLREAMSDYGSIYAVARDSGICQPVLNRFYRGDRDLHLKTADKLADFFGMKLTRPTTKTPRSNRRGPARIQKGRKP